MNQEQQQKLQDCIAGNDENKKKIEDCLQKIDKLQKRLLQYPHCTVTIALGICFILSISGVSVFAALNNSEGTYSFAALAIVCLIGLIVVNCYYIVFNYGNKND